MQEHWVQKGENPPEGLILCAQKDEAIARYALEGLPNKVMASEYRMALPNEKELVTEIERTKAMLHDRKMIALASTEAVGKKAGVSAKGSPARRRGAPKGHQEKGK